ncbi:MAG: deoxyguanosinetriphosphate triphosphohydrolase [FCB group bacterium]|nr:deoxyguanosinetriphosphate triphosphohydrolase [FCB group bacterium]
MLKIKLLTREDIEQREKTNLAPYAALSSQSRGRAYPQSQHPLRTCFQRDRDRIIHSTAFRRMEYKTQVFIPHERDHYRTRLTHTIEVAQISRTLARNLRLNEDLAEAIALVHDVGHTPFGHSGEDVLDELLKNQGGFNHNRQSLRIVDFLEQHYKDHPGLNLTYEVREGIVKHETKDQIILPQFHPEEQPTLEASLVDIADEITYNAHDIDDGLSSGIITFDDMIDGALFDELPTVERETFTNLLKQNNRYALVRKLLDLMVTDVLTETTEHISAYGISNLKQVRKSAHKICAYSQSTQKTAKRIKDFLNTRLYKHPKMITMAEWAKEIIETIYFCLEKNPQLLPPRFQDMLLTEDKEIVIADYIAGMTDRYAIKIYEELQ